MQMTKKNQRGSSLVEVLVALFVTAIGLLGVLAMQTTGLKSNQRAEFLTEAHMLASDMMNMIMAFDSFDNPASATFTDLEVDTSLDEVDCTSGCDRNSQYNHDRADWSSQISKLLPSGFGTVTYDDSTELFTITVMWDEERSGVTGKNCSGDASVDLACYVLEVQI